MEQVGVDIQAKARLDELVKAADQLGDFGVEAKKVSAELKGLARGSEDVGKLTRSLEALQRRVDASSKTRLSAKELKAFQKELNTYERQMVKLQEKQKKGTDDYSKSLAEVQEKMKGMTLPFGKPEAWEVKGRAERAFGGLGAMREEEMARIKYETLPGVQERITARMEQEEEAKSAERERGRWKRRFAAVGGMVIGGSIIAVATQAIRKWAQLDTELLKVERRFGNIDSIMESIGERLGYTRAEMIELTRASGQVTNEFRGTELQTLLGYGRVTGMAPTTTLGFQQMWRYSQRPQDQNRFLSTFEDFARESRMGQGRQEELMNVMNSLVRTMSTQMMGGTPQDVMNALRQVGLLWQGTERGIGERGADFLERLNQGMMGGGSNAQRLFFMRAYGLGQQGVSLTDVLKRMEAGALGAGNLEDIIGQAQRDFGAVPEEYRTLMMQQILGGQLKVFEIEQLQQLISGAGMISPNARRLLGGLGVTNEEDLARLRQRLAAAGTEEAQAELLRRELPGATAEQIQEIVGPGFATKEEFFERIREREEEATTKYDEAGQAFISAGETAKRAMEDAQMSVGKILGPTFQDIITGTAKGFEGLTDLLTGDVDRALQHFSEAIDHIAIKTLERTVPGYKEYRTINKWGNAIFNPTALPTTRGETSFEDVYQAMGTFTPTGIRGAAAEPWTYYAPGGGPAYRNVPGGSEVVVKVDSESFVVPLKDAIIESSEEANLARQLIEGGHLDELRLAIQSLNATIQDSQTMGTNPTKRK